MLAISLIERLFESQYVERGKLLHAVREQPVVAADLDECGLGIVEFNLNCLLLPLLPRLKTPSAFDTDLLDQVQVVKCLRGR